MSSSDIDCTERSLAASLSSALGESAAVLLDLLNGRPVQPLETPQGSQLLALASQHGLFPAVASRIALSRSAEAKPLAIAVNRMILKNTCRNLALLGETSRLVAALCSAGITAVPFKGGILSHMAHGSLGQRQAGDIDLFVRKEDLKAAIAELKACDYQLDPKWNSALREGHFRFDCECEMVNVQRQMCVDLHWEFTARNFSLPMPVDAIFSRLQPVRIQGVEILAFSPEDMVLILCLHAAKHHWHRLEWIFTISAFIHRNATLDWRIILERAAEIHLTRILATGLRLADGLFPCPIPAQVSEWERACAPAAKLADHAMHWICKGIIKPSPLQLRRYHAQGRDGLRNRIRYWFGVIFTPSEKDYSVERPPGFSWAYYLFRPVRLLSSSLASLFGWQVSEAGGQSEKHHGRAAPLGRPGSESKAA